MNHFAGPIPRHLYLWVDTTFTHREPHGFQPAVWYGLSSFPGRAWGLSVMLESGALYRNLPPHAVAFAPQAEPWTLRDAQLWDCYGYTWHALEYPFLAGLDARARLPHRAPPDVDCQYLFSLAPIGDAYSAAPDQSKEFQFLQTAGQRLTIQPTNRVVFQDASFNPGPWTWPQGLQTTTEIHHAEGPN